MSRKRKLSVSVEQQHFLLKLETIEAAETTETIQTVEAPEAEKEEETTENIATTVVSPYFLKGSFPVLSCDRISNNRYLSSCTSLAQALLGCTLCRITTSGQILRGKIVETESYPGSSDGASHSYKGQTVRNKAMFMVPGTAYVYTIYGMYHCFNISSAGEGAAVLIRALEPLQGEEVMKENRESRRKAGAKPLKLNELTNGPSKLCQALNIDKSLDQVDMSTSQEIWMEGRKEELEAGDIVNTTRVGIDGTGEQWSKLRLRWYILGNLYVSVRDKQEELRMKSLV